MTSGVVGDKAGPTFACREHYLEQASLAVLKTGAAKRRREGLCAKAGRAGGGVCTKQ